MTPGEFVDLDLGDGVHTRALVVVPGLAVHEALLWDKATGETRPSGWWAICHIRSGCAAADLAVRDPETAAALARDMGAITDWDQSYSEMTSSPAVADILRFQTETLTSGRAVPLSSTGDIDPLSSDDPRCFA